MKEPASAPGDERRTFPRIPLLTEVWIRDAADQRIHAKTRDLSRGGLCLQDDANALDVGDELKLEVRLPETEPAVLATGRVMWRSPGLAGLMFVDLDVDEANRIDVACEQALAELKSFQEEKTPERA